MKQLSINKGVNNPMGLQTAPNNQHQHNQHHHHQKTNGPSIAHAKETDAKDQFLTNADMRVMNILNDLLGEISDEHSHMILNEQSKNIMPQEQGKIELEDLSKSQIKSKNQNGDMSHININTKDKSNNKSNNSNGNGTKIKPLTKGILSNEEFNASNENLLKKINQRKESFFMLTNKNFGLNRINPNANSKEAKFSKSPPIDRKRSPNKKDPGHKLSPTTQTFIRHYYNKSIKEEEQSDQSKENEAERNKEKAQTAIDKPRHHLLKTVIDPKQFLNSSNISFNFFKKRNSSKTMTYHKTQEDHDKKHKHNNNNFHHKNNSLLRTNNNKKNSKLYDSLSATNQNEIKSIQSQLKETIIIGERAQNQNQNQRQGFTLHDITRKSFSNDKEDEDEFLLINSNNKRYRVLTRKGYVYDSLDDDESKEDIDLEGTFFIHPHSVFLYLHDCLLFFESIFFIVYLPLFFATSQNMSFNGNHFEYSIEILSEISYILDIFLHFFIAYYNFEEILITNLRLIIYHYLSTWFALDVIVSIPYTLLLSLTHKINEPIPFYYDYSNKNPLSLLSLLHMGKLIKTTCCNRLTFSIKSWLMDFSFYQKWSKAYLSLCVLLLSLHCLTCLFIFIGQVSYPNWIFSQSLESSRFSIVYIHSLYYIIATVFTIGYGDITVKNTSERIFNLFLLLFGIAIYSWTLSSISTYIQTKDAKTLEYQDKLAILDEIKIKYNQLPLDLYERITRYLKYKFLNEKKDKNVILDFLPITLRNNLVSEMYRDIIDGFAFFKTFKNTDFIVRVIMAFRPILVVKNDILVKKGDYIEEIIFVKRGNLTLEIPLYLSMREGGAGHGQGLGVQLNNEPSSKTFLNISQMVHTLKTKDDIMSFELNQTTKPHKSNDDVIDEEAEVQHAKILEIRRNEHFGDILMFLNKRSPLRVKVKSKHAELFFLYKTDAVEISMSYSKIWRKIIKKSLFNMEQIDRLINKATSIFTDAIRKEQGSLFVKKSKITMKKTLNQRDSIVQQFTQRANSLFSNNPSKVLIEESLSVQPLTNNCNSNNKNSQLYLQPFKLYLSPLIEQNNKKVNDTIIEHEAENSVINHRSDSKVSNRSSRSGGTIKMDIRNRPVDYSTIQSPKHQSLIQNTDEVSGSTNTKQCSTPTPFRTSEINMEIYPNEQFISLNSSNPIIINQVSNYINDIRIDSSIGIDIGIDNDNNLHHFNDTMTSPVHVPPIHVINSLESKSMFKRLQLCNVTTIEYQSMYKNINALFNYNSSQSSEFIDSVYANMNIKDNKSGMISNCKTNTFNRNVLYSPLVQRLSKPLNKSMLMNSITMPKSTKTFYDERSNNDTSSNCKQGQNYQLKNKDRTATKKASMKQIDMLSDNNININVNGLNGNNSGNKKPDLLNLISQNIEKNSQNMNNPVLFYSEFFKKVMNQENNKGAGGNKSNLNQKQKDLFNRLVETEKLIYTLSLSESN